MLRANFPHNVRAKREFALKARYADLDKLKDVKEEWVKDKRTSIALEITNLTKKLGHSKEALGVSK